MSDVAARCLDRGGPLAQRRTLGNEPNGTAERARPVECALRPPQHLDMVDVRYRQIAERFTVTEVDCNGHLLDHDARTLGVGAVDATHDGHRRARESRTAVL